MADIFGTPIVFIKIAPILTFGKIVEPLLEKDIKFGINKQFVRFLSVNPFQKCSDFGFRVDLIAAAVIEIFETDKIFYPKRKCFAGQQFTIFADSGGVSTQRL